MIFAQKVDIKEDVNVVPDIRDLLLPLRIATSDDPESLEEIIEWDLDLQEIVIAIVSQRLREIFTFVSAVSPSAATILSSQRAMASDKPAAANSTNAGMMSAAKDWFLTSKVLDENPILDNG